MTGPRASRIPTESQRVMIEALALYRIMGLEIDTMRLL
jgi:hypothetical protein